MSFLWRLPHQARQAAAEFRSILWQSLKIVAGGVVKNQKRIISIAIFVLVFCGINFSADAASVIDLRSDVNFSSLQKTSIQSDLSASLSLSADNDFRAIKTTKGRNGVKYVRYLQHFKNVPIWGEHVIVVSKQDSVTKMTGRFVGQIGSDISDVKPAFSSQAALGLLKKSKYSGMHFKNETSRLVIYTDESNQARLAYFVSFFADIAGGGKPTRPHFLIDAKTKETLKQWEGLTHSELGTGPGGNEKTGGYQYGVDYDFLDVSVSDDSCTMLTDNVKTVDLGHRLHGDTAFEYTCYENIHQKINGGFCPLNDAHYFGGIIYDLYSDWYGVAPLAFQLTMKVHYGTCYDNAFWDGSSMTFGDGCDVFYPLVSLDVSAHEVSHGFTEQNSGLIYSGQSGGINEAFSDIAGEAAEYYMNNTNDFEVGAQIFKIPNEALRYMYDPPLDGSSIGHADDYYNGIDVHNSSGVFNKAFYILATTEGWDVRMAFDCFVGANQNYWTPNSDFVDAARGVLDMAGDLGYPEEDVQDAFWEVGIPLNLNMTPVAAFIAPTTACLDAEVQVTDSSFNSPDSWLWTISPHTVTYSAGTSNTSQNPLVQFNSPGTYSVTLYISNTYGEDTLTKPDYITVNNGHVVELELLTDSYGSETTWDLKDSSQTTLFNGGSYGNSQQYLEQMCLAPGESYIFTIYDSFGDGICCNYGIGNYSLTNATTGDIYTDSSGEFQDFESTNFTIDDGSTAVITLLSPDDGAVLPAVPSQTFTWQADGTYRFKIQFSPTIEFVRQSTTSIPNRMMSGNSTDTLPVSVWARTWNKIKRMENVHGTVYWRVIGRGGPSNPIELSDTRSFSITP